MLFHLYFFSLLSRKKSPAQVLSLSLKFELSPSVKPVPDIYIYIYVRPESHFVIHVRPKSHFVILFNLFCETGPNIYVLDVFMSALLYLHVDLCSVV